MMKQPRLLLSAAIGVCLLTGFAGTASGQPEVMAWGNLTGIRVDGYLLELNTSMCIAQPDGAGVFRTGRERQTNTYSRAGKIETVKVQMRTPKEFRDPQVPDWAVAATETVEDTGTGSAKIDVEFSAPEDANIGGAYFCLDLPAALFSGGTVQLIGATPPAAPQASLAPGAAEQNEYLRATATGVRFITPRRQIEITFNEPTAILVRDDRRKGIYDIQVLLAVATGKLAAALPVRKSFALKVSGEVDRNPVEFTIDASRPGQMFDGLGGNFRLQNARTDPQVIQYSLDNVRLAWGRVEMPWSIWHPAEDVDPLAAARDGKANVRVLQAMEMARKLAQKGMPVIVSAWSAPNWAVLGALGGRGGFGAPQGAAPGANQPAGPGAPAAAGSIGGQAAVGAPGTAPAPATPGGRGAPGGAAPGALGGRGGGFPPRQPDGPRGNPLNPQKMDRIKESIAGYLIFLKEKYGVEAAMFSFNESDLGINVRQTPREHADLIRTLGAYFASRGLATKLALGDTSDADPIDFIKPAMKDPEAVKYVGAVDFHSWRGCTDEKLAEWRDAARQLNVPLLVGEGSTDAAAYRYPQIFAEQSFALYEINLYTRILAIAQPKSILQWQFTADYSVLAGGGIFNDDGPLRPTQRFWNLKQLASTPPRSFALPVKCNSDRKSVV